MNLPIVSINSPTSRAAGLPTRLHRDAALHYRSGRCSCPRHTRPGRTLLYLQSWLAGRSYCYSMILADLFQLKAPSRLIIVTSQLVEWGAARSGFGGETNSLCQADVTPNKDEAF
jgi:hypothetical protein